MEYGSKYRKALLLEVTKIDGKMHRSSYASATFLFTRALTPFVFNFGYAI